MTMRFRSATKRLVIVMALAWAPALLTVDVKVDHDKSFDFKGAQHGRGASGRRQMAARRRTTRRRTKIAGPVIMSAVSDEMARRGLKQAAGGWSSPTISCSRRPRPRGRSDSSCQRPRSECLHATATQSLEMMNHGALVLDMSAKDVIVWRGVADANQRERTPIARADSRGRSRSTQNFRRRTRRLAPRAGLRGGV
jgi:hypothetical protein